MRCPHDGDLIEGFQSLVGASHREETFNRIRRSCSNRRVFLAAGVVVAAERHEFPLAAAIPLEDPILGLAPVGCVVRTPDPLSVKILSHQAQFLATSTGANGVSPLMGYPCATARRISGLSDAYQEPPTPGPFCRRQFDRVLIRSGVVRSALHSIPGLSRAGCHGRVITETCGCTT